MRLFNLLVAPILASSLVGAGCASSSSASSGGHHEGGHHEGGHHEDGHHEGGHHDDGHEGDHHEGGHHEGDHHEGGHHDGGHHEGHRFDNPQEWAKRFEAANRDGWQKPEVVLEALGLGTESALVVADIGSATGYFPVRIAPLAKRVYGVDIEPTMVDYLNARATRENLPSLKSILGSATTPNLPEAVDVALVVNTYHHIQNRTAYFKTIEMNANGRLVIVDFRPDAANDFGPPKAMRLGVDVVERELVAAGYTLTATDTESLPFQYILTFTK